MYLNSEIVKDTLARRFRVLAPLAVLLRRGAGRAGIIGN